MSSSLKYFAYVSRAKVKQLHEQLSEMSVTQRAITRSREGTVNANVASDSLLGIIKAGFNFGTRRSFAVQETGQETSIQQLQTVLQHIHQHEKVLDLNELCRNRAGVALDAFAYTYTGEFFALANLARESGGIHINESALKHGPEEIVLSRDLLLQPARQENALSEVGPNNGALVSDMVVMNSFVGEYILSLACSLKYFSDMGGSWDEHDKEWSVTPHSGNYHFFNGDTGLYVTTLVFVTGMRGKTIMGTPLFLVHESNPRLTI